MFSPTASSAITSASIPTCNWNPPRPISGSAAAARPATASRGHQPIRSACRCTPPSQDGRYSRRRASLATHSSAPTRGPAGGVGGGGESRLIRSNLLQLRPAEQPAGPHQHHDRHRPDAADYGGGKRLEAHDEPDGGRHLVE